MCNDQDRILKTQIEIGVIWLNDNTQSKLRTPAEFQTENSLRLELRTLDIKERGYDTTVIGSERSVINKAHLLKKNYSGMD